MRCPALFVVASLLTTVPLVRPAAQSLSEEPSWKAFLVAASSDERAARKALDEIARGWRPGYAAMLVDVARLLPSTRRPDGGAEASPRLPDDPRASGVASGRPNESLTPALERPGVRARRRLIAFLEEQTGQRFGDDLRAWRRWMWSRKAPLHADYAVYKGEVYSQIDPAFRSFFPAGVKADIRLDEIDWGGVPVNGIPPLRQPRTIPAAAAGWLKDDHVVFGVTLNGESRAYPKRILAWHELATDRLGGLDLTIVYCTLCGTVIPYESRVAGRQFTFGTSGLLYRSNKLMFDEETRSLWSSLEGKPVLGALVGEGLQLKAFPVVTTTWGEWRRDRPETTVLSLDTGFKRDYREGAAYRDYFRTDRLMFDVPALDERLQNKDEVLVLRPEMISGTSPPVAISVELLRRHRLFAFDAGGRGLIVVTSPDGANRMYERGRYTFVAHTSQELRDGDGHRWSVTPDALVSESGERLPRVAAHRAFWFGWYAQHPNTILHR